MDTVETKVPPRNTQVVIMAFGLPIMTTLIVAGSMYAGHLITQISDRPTHFSVQSAPPKIDITVPQAAPPNINVSSAAPRVDVHVPQQAAPTVTVNTPPQAPPNITVNPPAATVTIMDKKEAERSATFVIDAPKTPSSPAAAAAPAKSAPLTVVTTEKPVPPVAPAIQVEKVATAAPAAPAAPAKSEVRPVAVVKASTPEPAADEPTLENLYNYASRYVDTYCKQRGLDPANETRRWNRVWQSNVEQAIADNIDSSEQSYINRVVITKRDYFNLNTASPEKICEACRIMLRYRDGQLAWLQAMKDALTNENMKKTMAFLAQGPK